MRGQLSIFKGAQKVPSGKYFIKSINMKEALGFLLITFEEFNMSPFLEHDPLEERVFNYKGPFKNFYCPLCRTKRAIVHNYKLTKQNFIQIFLITIIINLIVYPFTGAKGLFFIFLVWGAFEFFKRSLFKKEIPCPHCGFDASWYKKDVKVARRLVKEFWKRKGQNKSEPPQTPPEEVFSEESSVAPG